jgi:hypothetical protein
MKISKNKWELTFDELEFVRALEKIKDSYYTMDQEKIDEIKEIARNL